MKSKRDMLIGLAEADGFSNLKDWFEELHFRRKWSVLKMSIHINISRIALVRWMNSVGVIQRGMSDSQKLTWENPTETMRENAQHGLSVAWRKSKTASWRRKAKSRALKNNPAKSIAARKKISESKRGAKNAMFGLKGPLSPNYQGGYDPYGYNKGELKFTPELRKKVRERDGYICQECGKPNSKDVHHIDFVKTHNYESNLITLCRSCHTRMATHKKRRLWINYYQKKIMEIYTLRI